MRLRRKKKCLASRGHADQCPLALTSNGGMDFVSDRQEPGLRIRVLTILYSGTGQARLWKGMNISLFGQRVVHGVKRLWLEGRLLSRLLTDNGPEFTGRALNKWAHKYDVGLEHNRLGKPTNNDIVESFNGRLPDECLNQNIFVSLA